MITLVLAAGTMVVVTNIVVAVPAVYCTTGVGATVVWTVAVTVTEVEVLVVVE